MKRALPHRVPKAMEGAHRTCPVPDWVKEIRPEGTAKKEATRLGRGATHSSVAYWRKRLRMFPAGSIFANDLLWSALRDSIVEACSPWSLRPFHLLRQDVLDDFGNVPWGTFRHALRILVEDGEITFTPPSSNLEEEWGGYSRPVRRRAVRADINHAVEDRCTPYDLAFSEKRLAAGDAHLTTKRVRQMFRLSERRRRTA